MRSSEPNLWGKEEGNHARDAIRTGDVMSIKHSIRHLTVLVAVLTILSVFRTDAMQSEQQLDKMLTSERMRNGATLVLYSQNLVKPSEAARMRYLVSRKLAAGGASDTVFFLNYLPPGSKVASTVWLTYRAVHAMFPPPRFTAALVNDPDDHPFLIFVESGALETKFFIYRYRIDLAKRLSDAPPQLDPELREGWPLPAEPLSSVSYQLSNRDSFNACFVSSINAEWKNNTITLRADQNPNVCGSLLTAFDVNSAKWAAVQRGETAK